MPHLRNTNACVCPPPTSTKSLETENFRSMDPPACKPFWTYIEKCHNENRESRGALSQTDNSVRVRLEQDDIVFGFGAVLYWPRWGDLV